MKRLAQNRAVGVASRAVVRLWTIVAVFVLVGIVGVMPSWAIDCTPDPTATGCTSSTPTYAQLDTDQFAVIEWGLGLCVFLLIANLLASWTRRV